MNKPTCPDCGKEMGRIKHIKTDYDPKTGKKTETVTGESDFCYHCAGQLETFSQRCDRIRYEEIEDARRLAEGEMSEEEYKEKYDVDWL